MFLKKENIPFADFGFHLLFTFASVSLSQLIGKQNDVWLRICHQHTDNCLETRTFTPPIRSCLLTGRAKFGWAFSKLSQYSFSKEASCLVNLRGSRITCTATVKKPRPGHHPETMPGSIPSVFS